MSIINKSFYEKKFTDILQQEIINKNHVDTGALLRSVKATINESSGKIEIKYSSEYYIVYLEQRDFLKNFLKSNGLKQLIKSFTLEIIKNTFKNGNNKN